MNNKDLIFTTFPYKHYHRVTIIVQYKISLLAWPFILYKCPTVAGGVVLKTAQWKRGPWTGMCIDQLTGLEIYGSIHSILLFYVRAIQSTFLFASSLSVHQVPRKLHQQWNMQDLLVVYLQNSKSFWTKGLCSQAVVRQVHDCDGNFYVYAATNWNTSNNFIFCAKTLIGFERLSIGTKIFETLLLSIKF